MRKKLQLLHNTYTRYMLLMIASQLLKMRYRSLPYTRISIASIKPKQHS